MKRILLDQNVPRKLAPGLAPHHIEAAFARGWSSLTNGDLIAAAEAAGFDIMITADRNLAYQQNITGRRIAIIVLDTNRWPRIAPRVAAILVAVSVAAGGSFHEIECF